MGEDDLRRGREEGLGRVGERRGGKGETDLDVDRTDGEEDDERVPETDGPELEEGRSDHGRSESAKKEGVPRPEEEDSDDFVRAEPGRFSLVQELPYMQSKASLVPNPISPSHPRKEEEKQKFQTNVIVTLPKQTKPRDDHNGVEQPILQADQELTGRIERHDHLMKSRVQALCGAS